MDVASRLKSELGVKTDAQLKDVALRAFTGINDNPFLKSLSDIIGLYTISDLMDYANEYNSKGLVSEKMLAFGNAVLKRHVSDIAVIEVDPYNRASSLVEGYVDNVQTKEELITNPYKARIKLSISRDMLITAFEGANPIQTLVGQILRSMGNGLERHMQSLVTKIIQATTPTTSATDGFNIPVVFKNRMSFTSLTGANKPTSKYDFYSIVDSIVSAMGKRTNLFYTQNTITDVTKLIADDNITVDSAYTWSSTTDATVNGDSSLSQFTRQANTSDLVIFSGYLIKNDFDRVMKLIYKNSDGSILSKIGNVEWHVVQGLGDYQMAILEKGAIESYTQLDLTNADPFNGKLTINYYKHIWMQIQAMKYKFGMIIDGSLVATLPTGIGSALLDSQTTFKSNLVGNPSLKTPKVKKGTNS
jgi:hypothetical protein